MIPTARGSSGRVCSAPSSPTAARPKATAGRHIPGILTSESTSVARALATRSRCPTSPLSTWTRRSTKSRLSVEALSIPGRGGRSVGTPRGVLSDLPSTPAPRSADAPESMRRAVARRRAHNPWVAKAIARRKPAGGQKRSSRTVAANATAEALKAAAGRPARFRTARRSYTPRSVHRSWRAYARRATRSEAAATSSALVVASRPSGRTSTSSRPTRTSSPAAAAAEITSHVRSP